MPPINNKLFESVDKPFMNVLAENAHYDPQQGVFANVGHNLVDTADKLHARSMHRNRANQMNQALEEWQRSQAILRQRQQQHPAMPQHQQPYLWPTFAPPLTQGD